jgi:putative transposase
MREEIADRLGASQQILEEPVVRIREFGHRTVQVLYPMRILAYCLMTNHWNFVLWPENNGDLSAFVQRLTNTHTQRWQRAKNKIAYGHLYQGRFKSFPVEADEHFYAVVRYVERNALRANLVEQADSWRWGSLWRRAHHATAPLLTTWPIAEPRSWVQYVNQPQTDAEVNAIRRCVQRGSPFGDDAWVQRTARPLDPEEKGVGTQYCSARHLQSG